VYAIKETTAYQPIEARSSFEDFLSVVARLGKDEKNSLTRNRSEKLQKRLKWEEEIMFGLAGRYIRA
jgi:hypothetical protein